MALEKQSISLWGFVQGNIEFSKLLNIRREYKLHFKRIKTYNS